MPRGARAPLPVASPSPYARLLYQWKHEASVIERDGVIRRTVYAPDWPGRWRHALGSLHGFGIARRIEQVSRDVLQLNEGTVYTSLLRLQQQGWIAAEWGTSENNRKAKFYSITRRGQKQLEVETENWDRISGVIGRVLRL
jgi:PadR family transcriptional regulator, regulatory protein PadR